MACGFLFAELASAANEVLPEYTVKAGFLYNFAMLTEWPPKAFGESLEICLYGRDEFGAALDSIRGKTVSNRRINVRVVNSSEEAGSCHLLYISEMERASLQKLLYELAGRPVLTVTDDEILGRSGVAIYLRPERQRLVFEINTGATKSANLNLSARLLRLARGGGGE